MKLNKFILFLLGAGLLACSSVSRIHVKADNQAIYQVENKNTELEKLIRPYRDSMQAEMLEIIAYSDITLTPERPSGSLNNWSADALYYFGLNYVSDSSNYISLLNVGGLRTTINPGPVRLEDLFKVMPFDNFVVLLKLDASKKKEIEQYLIKTGGEPIAGSILSNGKLQQLNEDVDFWVITSDYLANGGDKMEFFKNPKEKIETGILLRDVFINTAKTQKNIIADTSNRIQL